jgi:hypothetical protein
VNAGPPTLIILPHNHRDALPAVDDVTSSVIIYADERDLAAKLRARGISPELDDGDRTERLLQ